MDTGGESCEFWAAIRELTDRYRDQCLWYLREDFYPASRDEVLRTIRAIQEHCDVEGFREAGRLKEWLLRLARSTPSV